MKKIVLFFEIFITFSLALFRKSIIQICLIFNSLVVFSNSNTGTTFTDITCDCPMTWTSHYISSSTGEILASDEFPLVSSLSNYCIYITGVFVIDKDMDFTSCRFLMDEGAQIKVRDGSKFGIYSTYLVGCTKLWYGIEMEDDSWISSIGSTISDALYGISKSNNLYNVGYNNLLIKNTNFYNNVIGIYSPKMSSAGGLMIGPDFTGNRFIGNRPLLESPNSEWSTDGDYSYAGIVIYNMTLIIGKQNPNSTEINTFSNLQAGICSFDNFSDIRGSVFSNIPGAAMSNAIDHSNSGVVANTGIFNGLSDPNSFLFSFLYQEGLGMDGNPSFNNVTTAIAESRGTCNISNNNMQNVVVGVSQVGSTNGWFSFLENNISNNRIYFSSRGIALIGNANLKSDITDNQLIMNTGSFAYALYLLSNSDCDILCKSNEITTNTNLIAAVLLDKSKAKLINNTITINQGFSNRQGFRVLLSPGSILSCNGVYTTVNSPNCPAFWLGNSDDVKLECNTALDCGIGFTFTGMNMNADFLTNTMDNCYKGLYYTATAFTLEQPDKGNLYLNDFSYGAQHDGSDFYIDLSLFRVLNSSSSDYPTGSIDPIYTPNSIEQWFYTDGSLPDCDLDSSDCNPFPASLNNNQDLFIVNWPDTNEWYNETSRYYAQRYLFKKLQTNPELFENDVDLEDFYLNNLNTEIGFFEKMETQIDTLFRSTISEKDILDSLYFQSEYIIDSILAFDNTFEGIESTTTLSELDDRIDLFNLLAVNIDSINSVFSCIQIRAIDSCEVFITRNNGFTCSNDYTQYEKDVNEIELTMLSEARFIPSTEEESVLQEIADLCSYEFGRAVLRARALLSVISEQDQDDEELCYSESIVNSTTKQNSNKSSNINIYPNPASGFLNYSIKNGNEYTNYKISLTNTYGELILKEVKRSSHGIINTSGIISGIYFMTFENKNECFTQRIFIK